ncbi:MAG: sporulation protein YqfD [Clostridia bacterium]|nr:sporulation protein YqfD [Clostridia bacterium]
MHRVFDFFVEYDIIRLEGKYVEKFFNIATRKNIKLWNVRYIGKYVAVFNCYRKDYGEISKISDKISAKLYIMDSKGVMHEVKKYKNRISLYVGALLMTGVIVLFSNTVCVITISGCDKISEDKIYVQLKESGLYKGMFTPDIDTKKVRQKMLAKNNDLSWIGITVKGATVNVEIVEKVPKPEIIDKNTPVNIVALKDGVIESITVRDGFLVAAKGDTVKKGQMLVSGVNESKQGDLMLVHSVADVKIKTWNYLTKSFPVKVTERIPTGEIKNRYALNLFGKQLNLFFGKTPDEKEYNIKTTRKSLFDMPVFIEKIECEKIEHVVKKYSAKEIFEKNKKKMYDEILNTLSENHIISDAEYNYTYNGENVIVDLCVIAVEDGGIEQTAQY